MWGLTDEQYAAIYSTIKSALGVEVIAADEDGLRPEKPFAVISCSSPIRLECAPSVSYDHVADDGTFEYNFNDVVTIQVDIITEKNVSIDADTLAQKLDRKSWLPDFRESLIAGGCALRYIRRMGRTDFLLSDRKEARTVVELVVGLSSKEATNRGVIETVLPVEYAGEE